jgi:hypothetical protein
VASDDAHALRSLNIPHPQGVICTATEQATAIGREGHVIDISGMPNKRRSIVDLLDIEDADRFLMTTTS